MSDLSKRIFDAGCGRDQRFADTPVEELVKLRILHQQEANTIAAELEYRQLNALRAVVSS